MQGSVLNRHEKHNLNRMQESNSFYESVYELVKQIPPGQVYTYGRVAWLLGFSQRARMVGTALKNMPPGEGIPAWRVVDASGRIAPGWPQPHDLLAAENVRFRSPDCVDLSRHLWNPESLLD